MDIKQLRDKATTLGFTFDKHPIKRGSGYVLIDPDGNKPLRDDYTASLSDIARHLETFADDDDIEGGISEPNKPPSSAAIKKAMAGHNDASAVKEALISAAHHGPGNRGQGKLDRGTATPHGLGRFACGNKRPAAHGIR
jgi:hypothetical protein